MKKVFHKNCIDCGKSVSRISTGRCNSCRLKKTGSAFRGFKHSEIAKNKMRLSHTGKKMPPFSREHIENLSKSKVGESNPQFGKPSWNKGLKGYNAGEKNNRWKGGITELNHKIRTSFEYKLWRNAVFERDNFTCIWCGQIGGRIEADHIKPFSLFPELRFAIDNGRTLCKECHLKIGWKESRLKNK